MLNYDQLSDSQKLMHDRLGSDDQKKIFLQRQETYGPFDQCHRNLGLAWTALIQNHFHIELEHPIPGFLAALMLATMKQVRATNVFHADNYDDMLNYNQFAEVMQEADAGKPQTSLNTLSKVNVGDWLHRQSLLTVLLNNCDTFNIPSFISAVLTIMCVANADDLEYPEGAPASFVETAISALQMCDSIPMKETAKIWRARLALSK